MLILTKLDARGAIVMDHGEPYALSKAVSEQFLLDRMRDETSAHPEQKLAVIRPGWVIIHRNDEPQQPC